MTNLTWVLALGVQQRTHESQEPSVFWVTDCDVQRTNEIDSFFVTRQNGQNINPVST